ncbi:MAG: hypothetical protein JNL11_08560 [Bdellovibrionaceae bacterium]|nr:hypothetical protein [Pseudobdellovibrionaceae bacterium]
MSRFLFLTFFYFFSVPSHSKECEAFYTSSTEKPITLSESIIHNGALSFVPRSNSLAMNILYSPIIKLRHDIQKILSLKNPLKFLTAWNNNGEAHVTVITPPEAEKLLAENERHLSQVRMDEIAKLNAIQTSDLKIIGLGSGKIFVGDCYEYTFFLIVESKNLIEIRRKIFKEFVAGGGKSSEFDPNHFFPHITIGYTHRDIHESDGLFKDKRSLDSRFKIVLKQ